MELTKRKREFLENVIQIYEESQEPVHYEAVAERVGVSKWTAYDMLKELEAGGLLERKYLTNPQEKMPGRSRLYFVPTPKSREIVNLPENLPQEWPNVRSHLLSYFRTTRLNDSIREIETLLEEISKNRNLPAVITGAYILTLLLLYVRSLGFNSLEIVRNLMTVIPQSELGLTLFAGMLLGILLKTASSLNLRKGIIKHVHNLQQNIAEINEPEKKLLYEYFQEAIEFKSAAVSTPELLKNL